MRIPEKVVAEVVKEASAKMSSGKYAQTQVGTWVQSQPAATQYMTAHVKEMGSPEAVVNAVFHASLMASCFARHGGRSVRAMTFAELDAVATVDGDVELKRRQPALFDYLAANVDNVPMRKVLTVIALGLDYVF